MSSKSKEKNAIADVLRNVASYHRGEGTFWVPSSSYCDLGYTLGARIRRADSKAHQAEYSPKHKDDARCRHHT